MVRRDRPGPAPTKVLDIRPLLGVFDLVVGAAVGITSVLGWAYRYMEMPSEPAWVWHVWLGLGLLFAAPAIALFVMVVMRRYGLFWKLQVLALALLLSWGAWGAAQ